MRDGEGKMPPDAAVKMLIWSRPFKTYLKGEESQQAHTYVHTPAAVSGLLIILTRYSNKLICDHRYREKTMVRKEDRGEGETGGERKKRESG